MGVFARDNAGGVSLGALGDGDRTHQHHLATRSLPPQTDSISLATVLPDGTEDAPSAAVTESDRKIFTDFAAAADEDGGVVEITATASGILFLAPVDGVVRQSRTILEPLMSTKRSRQLLQHPVRKGLGTTRFRAWISTLPLLLPRTRTLVVAWAHSSSSVR